MSPLRRFCALALVWASGAPAETGAPTPRLLPRRRLGLGAPPANRTVGAHGGAAPLVINSSASFEAHMPSSSSDAAFQAYVRDCQDSWAARTAMDRMDQGNSSHYSRERAGFVYMRSTWCALHFLGGHATSIVDVGSSWPPFLRSVDWVKGDMTIVSKYFPTNGGPPVHACSSGSCKDPHSSINVVMQDFYQWTPDRLYDLVLCSQVLEHVDDPSRFLRKLLGTGRTVLASVPYFWKDYHMDFHKQHFVGLNDMRAWAGRKELYSFIANEDHGGQYAKRLLAVFQGTA